jgi:hypothetical protein
MAAQTSWLSEVPAASHSVSIEIEDAGLAKIGLGSDEFYGSGLPALSETAPSSGGCSA